MTERQDDNITRATLDGLRVCALLLVPALAAWITGRPTVFPSLGPSAFALVVQPQSHNTAWRVIGGHLVGVLSGLIAYHLLATGLSISHEPPALTLNSLRLIASAIVSLGLTTAGMLVTRTRHAPACATTLIISLGLMPRLVEGGIIMMSVMLMYAVHRLVTSLASTRCQ